MKKPATKKPICLDLFCGAGGAAMGYARAGYFVIGVDWMAKDTELAQAIPPAYTEWIGRRILMQMKKQR